jgi:hypothetical protein
MTGDIFQKSLRFNYGTTAEWNVVIFWYVVFLMIYKNKNNVTKLKNLIGDFI